MEPLVGFTETNFRKILTGWPLAVSLDDGDFGRVRELCNGLRWADYLWLGLKKQIPRYEPRKTTLFAAKIYNPKKNDSSIETSVKRNDPQPIVKITDLMPKGEVEAVVELKAIRAALETKLEAAVKHKGTWSHSATKILAKHFQKKLREANKQIGSTKEVLHCGDLPGVCILIDEEPLNFDHIFIHAYLSQTVTPLSHLSLVIYLPAKTDAAKNILPALLYREPLHDKVGNVIQTFNAMWSDIRPQTDGSIAYTFPELDLLGRIRAEPAIFDALRADWRKAVSEHKLRFSYVARARYVSGFPAALPLPVVEGGRNAVILRSIGSLARLVIRKCPQWHTRYGRPRIPPDNNTSQ